LGARPEKKPGDRKRTKPHFFKGAVVDKYKEQKEGQKWLEAKWGKGGCENLSEETLKTREKGKGG